MLRHLREAALESGDRLPDNRSLGVMVRRWEDSRGGIAERYHLHFCRAFGLHPDEFGITTAGPQPGAAVAIRTQERSNLVYGGCQGHQGASDIDREVWMAAHESSEHGGQAERRDIGDATLDQFRADVVRLSREFMTGEPYPLFTEMRRVRDRMHAVLDGRVWPRDRADLYFLLGALNGLMASAADDLGNTAAAEEFSRTAWAYATAIDSRPMMGWVRFQLATFAHWSGFPRRAADLARSGLEYINAGPNGAVLYLQLARAAARLGDAGTVRQAVRDAEAARELAHTDDLAEIGGEFCYSVATQRYYAGAALGEISGAEAEASAELERAALMYDQGPGPGEDHGYQCRMLTQIELAAARLGAGQLDGAEAAMSPVLALPPGAAHPGRHAEARASAGPASRPAVPRLGTGRIA